MFYTMSVGDFMKRCSWAENADEIYVRYHNEEWGVPVYEDAKLFEMLILESFQAGLSWITILKKRENFRNALDQFDILKIVQYDDAKIEELMQNKGIVRNRLKIKATINNAKIFLDIQKEYGSFSAYIWHFTNHEIIYGNGTLTRNELSDTISKDLSKRGMKFVGSVIIYAYLQAIGIIYDHHETCFMYKTK